MTLFIAVQAFAQDDFEYTYQGQTLTYTVLDPVAKTCMTREGMDKSNGGNVVTGALVVPPTASDGTETYTVTEIGYCGFAGSDQMTSISLPNTIEKFNEYSFYGCKKLENFVVPNSVVSFGQSTFSSCMGLKTISIPNSVTTVGDGAFVACHNLASITFPNSVTSIGAGAFEFCWALKNVKLPSGLRIINYGLFWGCHSLAYVEIPSSVTKIYDYAFHDCPAMTKVRFPKNVNYVGPQIFHVTDNITHFYCLAKRPPTCQEGAFSNANLSNMTLYVPIGSANLYKNANEWKRIPNIQEYDFNAEALRGDVNGDGLKNITDASLTVSHILGKTPAGFLAERADMNGDNTINVTDISHIINTALGRTSAPQRAPQLEVADHGNLFIRDFFIEPGQEAVLPIRLKAPRRYGALQTDIYLPEGIEVVHIDSEDYDEPIPDAWLNPARATATHILASRMQNDGALRVIVYTVQNLSLRESNTDDAIFYVRVRALPYASTEPSPVWFRGNVFNAFVNGNIEEYKPADSNSYINVDGVMGKADIEVAAPATFYNMQGIPVANPERGKLYIRICNGKAYKVIF